MDDEQVREAFANPPNVQPGDQISFALSDGTVWTGTLKSWSSGGPLFGGMQEVTLTVEQFPNLDEIRDLTVAPNPIFAGVQPQSPYQQANNTQHPLYRQAATDDCECADGVEFFGGPHHHLGNIDKTEPPLFPAPAPLGPVTAEIWKRVVANAIKMMESGAWELPENPQPPYYHYIPPADLMGDCPDAWHLATGAPYQCPSCGQWMGEGGRYR